MPISDKVHRALSTMKRSCTTEANAIADCLHNIMENDDPDDPIDDKELLICARELSIWAQFFIKAVRP